MTRVSRMVKSYLDDLVDAHIVIPSDHHAIHDGHAFVVSGGTTLASAATKVFGIITGSDPVYPNHLLMLFRVSGEANVFLYEGSNFSGGVAQTAINRNRNSSNTPKLTVYDTPTVVSDGTNLLQIHIGSGNNAGGEDRGHNEFVLSPNTKYLVRVTSEAAGNDVSWMFEWYDYKVDLPY